MICGSSIWTKSSGKSFCDTAWKCCMCMNKWVRGFIFGKSISGVSLLISSITSEKSECGWMRDLPVFLTNRLVSNRQTWGQCNAAGIIPYLCEYTHRTERLSPHCFSPLDPIVNVSSKNHYVGSLSYIFHSNMMIIYYSWHKLKSFCKQHVHWWVSIVLDRG